jgi:DNA-binding transcriptional regulator YiaG
MEVYVPNLAGVLKNEIRRLARKEVRASVMPLRRLVATMRRRIAEQRRLIAEMERLAKRSAVSRREEAAATSDDGQQIRFSPQWVKAHRKKLKMSRKEYAKLVGVSAQSIFGWESGRTRPRRRALESWRKLRSMGTREIKSMAAPEGRRAKKAPGGKAGRRKARGRAVARGRAGARGRAATRGAGARRASRRGARRAKKK